MPFWCSLARTSGQQDIVSSQVCFQMKIEPPGNKCPAMLYPEGMVALILIQLSSDKFGNIPTKKHNSSANFGTLRITFGVNVNIYTICLKRKTCMAVFNRADRIAKIIDCKFCAKWHLY
jgi:hypothetical protein